jgi:hypothetical protein
MITRYSDFVHSGNRKEPASNFLKEEEIVNEGVVEDLIRKVQLDSFDDEEEEEFEIPNFQKEPDTKKQIQMEDFIDPAFIKPKIVEPVVKREEYREEPKFEEPKIPIDPLAYQIFRDKSETFECKVMIEGSNVSNTAVRLLLESQEWNIFFKGSIENGICRIPLKKMSILSPGLKGKIILEVIVDGEIFYPWYETFQVQNSKNVKVEVMSQSRPTQTSTRVQVFK